MRNVLRLILGATLLATFVTAPPPAAAASCTDPIGDPLDCIPCWDGGSSCPCDLSDPFGCGPCDPVQACVPDECDTGVCDVYVPDQVDPYVDSDGSVNVEYRECNMQGWCRTHHPVRVPTSINQLPRNPSVVDHGNGSFSANYTQCNQFGSGCQTKTAATTPNSVGAGVPATYSPAVPGGEVYTPGVPEACAPFAVVCVSASPIYVATVPGVGPVLLVPASSVQAGVTSVGFTTPSVVTTPFGPYPVTQDPVSIVVCRDTCAVPTGISGGPYVQGGATVTVGSFSRDVPIGLP